MSFPVDPVVLPFLPQLPNGPQIGKDEPTDIVVTGSGFGSGNQRWSFPMLKVTFSWDVLTDPDTLVLEQFFAARSNIRGWLFWDDSDNTALLDPVGSVGASVPVPLNGDGTNRVFQL